MGDLPGEHQPAAPPSAPERAATGITHSCHEELVLTPAAFRSGATLRHTGQEPGSQTTRRLHNQPGLSDLSPPSSPSPAPALPRLALSRYSLSKAAAQALCPPAPPQRLLVTPCAAQAGHGLPSNDRLSITSLPLSTLIAWWQEAALWQPRGAAHPPSAVTHTRSSQNLLARLNQRGTAQRGAARGAHRRGVVLGSARPPAHPPGADTNLTLLLFAAKSGERTLCALAILWTCTFVYA